MRRPLIAGNWKMNLDQAGAGALAAAIAERANQVSAVDLLICPASVHLHVAAEAVRGSRVELGAQNMYHEADGAFTGEISAAMLLDLGCTHVILGHSERRHILGETNEAVRQKTVAALKASLVPIVCVGERLDEREAGRTGAVIREQMDGSLAGIEAAEIRRVVIAYEPVWAIGTGKVATPDQAEQVHADLRRYLSERYNGEVAEAVRILYGGSVKPGNAADLLAQANVDGALVGGASLSGDDFLGIAAAGGR